MACNEDHHCVAQHHRRQDDPADPFIPENRIRNVPAVGELGIEKLGIAMALDGMPRNWKRPPASGTVMIVPTANGTAVWTDDARFH
jgi:hypothetical protein